VSIDVSKVRYFITPSIHENIPVFAAEEDLMFDVCLFIHYFNLEKWDGAYNSKYYVRPEDRVIVVYLTQLRPTNGLNDWDEINAVIKIALGIKP
jgi:hypothetical protein